MLCPGDKNSMGCFVRGGKSSWDVLSRVAKNGMGCFVLGCFVRLPCFDKIILVTFSDPMFSKYNSNKRVFRT